MPPFLSAAAGPLSGQVRSGASLRASDPEAFPRPIRRILPAPAAEALRRALCTIAAVAAFAAVPQCLGAQGYVAQLVLRPPESHVIVRTVAGPGWRRAELNEFLRQGDSLRVTTGSAELFYRSGERKIFTSGARLVVAGQPAARTARQPAWRAALETLMDLLPGGGDSEARERSLESPIAEVGVVSSASVNRAASASSVPIARFPDRPWLIGPETAALRWSFFPDHADSWLKVQLYPATDAAGCPAAGAPLVDTVLVGRSLLRPYGTAGLQPSRTYRIEVGVSDLVRTGCLRTLSEHQAASAAAELDGLRREFADGGTTAEDEATIGLLRVGVLVRHGLALDALVLLEDLIRSGGAPTIARSLWEEIAVRNGLARVNPWR